MKSSHVIHSDSQGSYFGETCMFYFIRIVLVGSIFSHRARLEKTGVSAYICSCCSSKVGAECMYFV